MEAVAAFGAAAAFAGAALLLSAFFATGDRRFDRVAEWAFVAFAAFAIALALVVRQRLGPETGEVVLVTSLGIAGVAVLGVLELLSTLGHILSYARVMALGTASVMMALAANRMVGAVGSVVVGVLFALLFHFVNFAIGLFSPTIHALRLHYVEFFGTFFSPGGVQYRPLRHWQPTPGRARG